MSDKRKTLEEMAEKVKIDKMIKERLAMYDDDPLAKLFSMVARHLTGRQIFARLREPYFKNCHGIMLPAGNGEAIIDITPGRTLAQQFRTFLHETAHARLHYYYIDTGNTQKPSASEDLDYEKYNMKSVTKHEAEANFQADKWDTWASDPNRLREAGYKPGEPVEFYKLKVLAKIKVYYEEK